MSRDKQTEIEEMAKVISTLPPVEIYGARSYGKKIFLTTHLAEHLYIHDYRKASEVAREIFEELESVFYLASYTVQRPMGSLTTKTIEGIHMRNEDYHTIKKKYTEEGK